jgi:hypothetical protein
MFSESTGEHQVADIAFRLSSPSSHLLRNTCQFRRRSYYALPLPRQPLSVGTFLILNLPQNLLPQNLRQGILGLIQPNSAFLRQKKR